MARGRRAAPPAGPFPWLVYFHGEGNESQTFCCGIPSSSLNTEGVMAAYSKSIPALHGKLVLSCSHGWLILRGKNEKALLSLCNASTFETITLPELKFDSRGHERLQEYSCLMTSSPNSPDCKVLCFFENLPLIMLCQVGDKKEEGMCWTEINYRNQVISCWCGELPCSPTLCFRRPVLCGGKIYADLSPIVPHQHFRPRLWSIELSGKKEDKVGLELSQLDDNHLVWAYWHTRNLKQYRLESCGELFDATIFVGGVRKEEVLAVEVHRFNFDTMGWERSNALEGCSFFLSAAGYGFSCPVSRPGCIYFTSSEDPSLYCYNLEDDSISVSIPCPNLPTPSMSPLWIMPEFSPRTNNSHNLGDNTTRGEHEIQFDTFEGSNNQRNEDGTGTSETPMDNKNQLRQDLPLEVLQEVSKCLMRSLDYMSFRAASRICRSAAPLADWRTELSQSQTVLSSPLLMFADSRQGGDISLVYKFVDPLRLYDETHHHSYKISIHDSLNGVTTIHYANQGWLLMTRHKSVCIYNPFTKDVLNCSNVPEQTSVFFTSQPTKTRCFLLGISLSSRFWSSRSKVYLGEEKWSGHWSSTIYKDFEQNYCSPTFFQDTFYYLSRHGQLAALKVEEAEEKHHNLSFHVFDEPVCPWESFHHNFLVECCGDLLLVLVGTIGKGVGVYKLINKPSKTWERVRSLGSYNLYLSRSSSLSAAASSGKDNRIYFPRFRGSSLVFFSLNTGKWHTSGSREEPVEDFRGTRLMLNSCWILPSWY